MDFCDERVKHRNLGKGTVVALEDGYITILFDEYQEEKTFQYPKTIGTFIELENKQLNELAKEQKMKLLEEENQLRKLRQEKMEEERLIRQAKARQLGKKVIQQSNIAFKLNFCDGGKGEHAIGYRGICSEKVLEYNTRKSIGCKQPDNKCHKQYVGKLEREELERLYEEAECLCHESKLLEEWRAYVGVYQSGVNKGKTKRFKNAKINKLAILTTKRPEEPEEERFIFGVFLIDNHHEGSEYEEGYVAAHQKYRITLSEEEAKMIQFWRYYANINNPEKPAFSTGLNRYLDDIQAAQILRAITKVKRGTDEEQVASEFFNYYCKLNGINTKQIPSPLGALKYRG